jgi:hypothetical protein
MRVSTLLLLAFIWLIANEPAVMAQGAGAGGASSSGGSARGGGGTTGPATAPTSPSVTAPAVPAPGISNAPVDPGRNVNTNPPRSIDGAAPGSTTGPATSAPAPRIEQPGVSTGGAGGKAASRPGAAQSPNSDGYAECMAMGPATSDASRESWSATCDRARLPPK